MKKTLKLIAAAAALSLSLCACGSDEPVSVMRADMLTQAAVANDRFAGVVVSENVVQISRESDKTIEEIYVSAGDQVRANEKLFSYDIDELNLTIDKQELEMDKLEQQIKDCKTQITNLEKQIKSEKDKDVKATLELTLRTANTDLTQAQYDKSALQTEIDYNKKIVKNADVRSPIAGTIRSIDENGDPFITIQQAGAYQVKGTLNELSLNAGIMEGVSVTVISRLDPTQTWSGMVSLVDYNNASGNEYDSMYGTGDPMTTSSNYPFYITLDSTDGLLLGQHVYIQVSAAPAGDGLLYIPESYLVDTGFDETTGLATGSVWMVGEDGKLTLAQVTLGDFDLTTGSYSVVDGLSADSYVADPANPGCEEGAEVALHDADTYVGSEETVPTGSETPGSDPTGSEPVETVEGTDPAQTGRAEP